MLLLKIIWEKSLSISVWVIYVTRKLCFQSKNEDTWLDAYIQECLFQTVERETLPMDGKVNSQLDNGSTSMVYMDTSVAVMCRFCLSPFTRLTWRTKCRASCRWDWDEKLLLRDEPSGRRNWILAVVLDTLTNREIRNNRVFNAATAEFSSLGSIKCIHLIHFNSKCSIRIPFI